MARTTKSQKSKPVRLEIVFVCVCVKVHVFFISDMFRHFIYRIDVYIDLLFNHPNIPIIKRHIFAYQNGVLASKSNLRSNSCTLTTWGRQVEPGSDRVVRSEKA